MSSRAWYRSLYWRIAIGFILLVAALLLVQGGLTVWLVARSASDLPGRPGDLARLVAADLGIVLASDPGIDLEAYLRQNYRDPARPVVVVLADGRVFSTGPGDPPENLIRMALARRRRFPAGARPGPPAPFGPRGGFFGLVPIFVGGRDVGSVSVLPTPPWASVARQLGPLLGAGAVLLLTAGTGLAALLIFRPAHRRLFALETAAARLGGGDLAARAPEDGGDEIAAVAQAFNRMARDLAARAEEIAGAVRARRQLLADVSHELMTPLTAIRGYLETLRMPTLPIDDTDRSRYLEIIEHETHRLERLIGDLLDLARLEAGGGAFSIRDAPVGELLARVTARHDREAIDRDVRLQSSVEPGADLVRADPDRLEQALDNLAANALRHTARGGSVTLTARRRDGRLTFAVTDTGEGIPPEHVALIFDRFYKVDAARSGAAAGSGLGLSIVKAIVERMGGTVVVTSRLGEGTTFTIDLPEGGRPPAQVS